MKPHQKLLLAAIAAVAVLQFLPFGGFLSLPFVYLNTHFHELCHALAAIATRGEPEKILVFSDGSGLTPIFGGWIIPVASAGYIGSALIGGAMIYWGRTQKGARSVFLISGIALSASALLLVRGDGIGIFSAIFWCLLLFVAATKLKGDGAIFGAQFLGALQCLNALQSFAVLLHISRVSSEAGDATIMQRATGIPALLWASLWAIFSVSVLFCTLRAAWNSRN